MFMLGIMVYEGSEHGVTTFSLEESTWSELHLKESSRLSFCEKQLCVHGCPSFFLLPTECQPSTRSSCSPLPLCAGSCMQAESCQEGLLFDSVSYDLAVGSVKGIWYHIQITFSPESFFNNSCVSPLISSQQESCRSLFFIDKLENPGVSYSKLTVQINHIGAFGLLISVAYGCLCCVDREFQGHWEFRPGGKGLAPSCMFASLIRIAQSPFTLPVADDVCHCSRNEPPSSPGGKQWCKLGR